MTLRYAISDEQWNMLIQDVADHFDEVTISRGFQYYKQERVQDLILSGPRYVEAFVSGNEAYEVEMNLDFFLASHCTCPVDGMCKHMFAVLLTYAYAQERPMNMLVNAKSITALKLTNLNNRNIVKFPEKKSVTESRLRERIERIPSMSVVEWHQLFGQCVTQLPQDIRSLQYAEQATDMIMRLKPTLTKDIEYIYMLNVHLFILSKLLKKRLHHTDYYYNHSGDSAITDLMESIENYYSNGEAIAVNPDNHTHLQQTLAYIRGEMLEETNDKHYYTDVYYSFWHYWICPYANDNTPYSEELLKLEQSDVVIGTAHSSFHLLMAQVRMNFYMVNDEESWNLLKAAKSHKAIPSNMSLYYLYFLSHQQQWSRLLSWLTALTFLYHSYRRDYLTRYMEFWELLIAHLPEAENAMWDTLVEMLPYTRDVYEAKLLQHERWKQWMDYHLSTGSDPAEFRVTELAPLEKFAPQTLLPFYHQAVERYVMIKNRDGYKAAVKLLKRLAKLYRRIKQEDRWEQFLTTFIGRHSRLRALQEELRKGKLLQ